MAFLVRTNSDEPHLLTWNESGCLPVIDECTIRETQGFCSGYSRGAGGDAAKFENLDEIVNKARREMGEAILDRARKEHAYPLRRVLGVLPVDEMAELAETLINLQALKEKVTKSSETVGGFVDVAIITKSEGLVWVKRKHFFDIGLNSRYLVRQQNRLTK